MILNIDPQSDLHNPDTLEMVMEELESRISHCFQNGTLHHLKKSDYWEKTLKYLNKKYPDKVPEIELRFKNLYRIQKHIKCGRSIQERTGKSLHKCLGWAMQ